MWRSSVSLTTSVSRGSAGPSTEVLSPRLISALGCSTEPSSSTIFLSLQPDNTPSSFSCYTAALFGPLWSPESLTVSVCTAGDIFTLKIPLARLQPEYWILKVLTYLVISKQYIVIIFLTPPPLLSVTDSRITCSSHLYCEGLVVVEKHDLFGWLKIIIKISI